MARTLHAICHADGVFEAQTALHVGGAGASLVEDMPLARNGKGGLYIPGTSLAGPMRDWWNARYGAADADIFWGRVPNGENGTEGHASRIFVADASVTGTETEIRDGIKINAETGAAASGFKFDREVLPPGARIGLAMRFEIDSTAKSHDGERKFATLLNALSLRQIRIGAAKTRGLGVVAAEIEATRVAIDQREGMLSLLTAKANASKAGQKFDFASLAQSAAPQYAMTAIVDWQSLLPMFSLGASHASAIDDVPLVSGTAKNLVPLLTGASIKGALRSQASRICRTLFGNAPEVEHELVIALFGAAGEKAVKGQAEKLRPGMAAVSVADCVTGPSFSAEEWRAILGADGSDSEKSVNAQRQLDGSKTLKGAHWRVNDHVSIDRWTGGAADGALFNVISPGAGQTGHFNISVDGRRLAFKSEDVSGQKTGAAIALLLLVLRDLSLGKISFGFGATRGNGSLAVLAIKFKDVGETFETMGFSEVSYKNGFSAENALAAFDAVKEHWANYCNSQTSEAGAK
jgi:CRISPR/Cas system CSM-associated protein Csm3 (group 7 of RAMP superfamily)